MHGEQGCVSTIFHLAGIAAFRQGTRRAGMDRGGHQTLRPIPDALYAAAREQLSNRKWRISRLPSGSSMSGIA